MTVFIISVVRTVVPTIVGALFTWLASFGLIVPEEGKIGLSGFLFVLFTGVYYLLVRLLEERYPQIGILLGFAKSPDSYSNGPGVEVTTKHGNEVNITVTPSEEPTVITGTTLPNLNTEVVTDDRVPGPDHRA